MVTIKSYDPIEKRIVFADDSFSPELTLTLGLYAARHWNYTVKDHETRRDFIMTKVKRYGGVAWILRELSKFQAKDIAYAQRINDVKTSDKPFERCPVPA